MIYGFTHTFADSSSGIGALGVDGKAFLIQLVTFGLAFLVLRHYAFQPILKVMRERRETIDNSVKQAEQIKKEKAELEVHIEQALRDSRAEADKIIAEAHDTARDAIREAEEKARQKADAIVKEADSRITQDAARARQALEKDLVGLISEATEAIIDEKVDATKDAKLIEKALGRSA